MAVIAEVTRPYARGMEVTVGRGSELASEIPVNPSMTTDPDTGETGRYVKVHSDFDYFLLNGFEIAPVANHDNHRANWGAGHTTRTVVQAETLTHQGIMDAIDRRAVYASEDQNLALWLYAEDRVRQGSKLVTLNDRVDLRFRVIDPDISGQFQVNVYLGTVGGDEVTIQQTLDAEGGEWVDHQVALPGKGRHFVYLEVLEPTQNRMTWSAPIFVEVQ